MTLTFNSHKYGELLSQYQPKLIRTEAENEAALAIVEALMHRPNRSPEENELFVSSNTLFVVLTKWCRTLETVRKACKQMVVAVECLLKEQYSK